MSLADISSAQDLDSSGLCRVLVVEDDPVCQDVVLLMLDRLGYHAELANDGVEALSALHAATYDVVLMDIQMPRMGGMEAARLIRNQLESVSQPIIVALTADVTPRCQEECRQAGMDGHLAKPIHIGDLAEALENRSVRPRTLEMFDDGDPEDGSVPAASVTAAYDPSVLESLFAELGIEGTMRTELIQSFISDSRVQLAAVVAAGDATDCGALAFEAHAIKSASATIGFRVLSEMAHEIEEAAKAAPGELDIVSQTSRLAAEFQRAIDALSAALIAESD